MIANGGGIEETLAAGQFKGSLMGEFNSRATHNGGLVSEQAHSELGRGAAVQWVHALAPVCQAITCDRFDPLERDRLIPSSLPCPRLAR